MALKKFVYDATILTVARVYQAAANFLVLPVLARFLNPTDFGLAAAAASVVFLANVLADAGLGNSLVGTPFEDRAVWSSVFWMSASWAICLSSLILALAVPIGWLLDEPRLTPLIAFLAVLPIGPSLVAAPVADLQQRHQFGWLAASDIAGGTAGAVSAVWLAIGGTGPWALVAQPVASLIAKVIVIGSATRFRPTFSFQWHLIGGHMRFARDTAAQSIVLFLNTQMDNILIARFFGASALGQYSMAYRIMSLPQILGSAHGALYARLVNLREDKDALRELTLTATTLTALIVFPPMALLCVSSKSMFAVFLSPRWAEAATIFSIFAPIGALRAIGSVHSFVLMAIGRTDTKVRMTAEQTVLWLFLLALTLRLGIIAVSIGLVVSVLAYYPRMLSLFLATIECRISDYVCAMRIPALASIFVGFCHLMIMLLYPATPVGEVWRVLLEIPASYVAIGWVMRRQISEAILIMRTLLPMADSGS